MGRCASIDSVAEGVELLERDVPLTSEDVARELTPVRRDREVGVGG